MSTSAFAMPRQRARAQAGFTLLEVMIVVAIIAIIAGIIASNYQTATQKSMAVTIEADLKQIATAIEMYHQDNGVYPPTSQNFTISMLGGNNNPYLKSTPTLNGILYYYMIPGQYGAFEIRPGYTVDGAGIPHIPLDPTRTDLWPQPGFPYWIIYAAGTGYWAYRPW